jgi:pSer/pThr/pTyr-binding forkhead associated (FHA) protein
MAKLIVLDVDRTYLVDLAPGETLRVGRSAACDLPCRAPRASRRHCAFVPRGEGHAVRDLGSTNGTLLNGAPFAEEAPLHDGDLVDAAGCRIVYRASRS